ncbi:Fas-binding factor 1 [Liparis tanakae]|uniref:Fas-binding factor 1 n=1 Tax=Liparis tanakae TaxID=230148 RepID=A0A4Z2F818_9TELE|nr:Fas-binding factor 1 [Liparis tanakae]
MAAKKGKPPKSSPVDDALLDSIFDDKKLPVRGKATRIGPLTRSSATDNIFSMLAEQVKKDGDAEDSDVSAADPSDILKNMKDIDDMDADLFALKKKPSSAPAPTKKDPSTSESKAKPDAAGEAAAGGRKPHSAPSSTAQNYRKFIVSDLEDDPLADLLDDFLPDEPKPRVQPAKPQAPPSASPKLKSETSKAAAKKPSGLTFDDDMDDLMDKLVFDSDKNKPKKKEAGLWPTAERSEAPQRPRTKIYDILETSPRLLERPPTGERKEQPPERSSAAREDDFTFGSYQPTLGSTPEGRQSRRQSVRFSTEDGGPSTPEKKPKPVTPTRQRTSADWLGLKKHEDRPFLAAGAEEPGTSAGSPKAPSSPSLERSPSRAGGAASSHNTNKHTKLEAPREQREEEEEEEEDEEEEDDWLAGALSRKKAQSQTSKRDSSGPGEELDLESPVSRAAPGGREDALASAQDSSGVLCSGVPLGRPGPADHSSVARETSQRRGIHHDDYIHL